MIGKTISHYKILQRLGEGGMGVVYKAEDTKLKREVAVKFLSRQIAGSGEERARFKLEAQAAAALNHPNIATIHAIEEADDEVFIVMEYIEGRELKEIIQSEIPDPRTAVGYAVQIASGLQAAHEKGIIHRDIKSANILITGKDRVKIMDFGLAKIRDEAQVTTAGTTFGTVAYMSPEQAAGERIDHRTDIWSLGVVLYEMLTGQVPFPGDYGQAVIYAILNEEPPPIAEFSGDVDERLQAITTRALKKDKAERYQSAGAILSDLENVQASSGAGSPGRISRQVKRRWPALTLATLILIAAVVWVLQRFGRNTTEDTGNNRSVVAVLPFTVHGNSEYAYLSEGMVDLMSTKLDGAGGRRSVDPRAVLGVVGQQQTEEPDLETSRNIARRLQAGFFVLGNIVEIAGQLQLSATLYDASDGIKSLAEGTASGTATDLFEMVDAVTAKLIVGDRDDPGERVTQIAAVTTNSLPALKDYLKGEEAFRSGQFAAALDAFRRATEEDTSFALAWYKLSVAAEWNTQSKLAVKAAAQAFAHSARLSGHDRQMLEAFLLWRRGETARAEALYRTIVAVYPADVEAWFQLGEVVMHQGPLLGGSIADSRPFWEEVLAFEPDHLQALWHLARIPARNGNKADLDTLVARILKLNPEGDRALEMLALQALVDGDTTLQRQVVSDLRLVKESTLILTVWSATVYSDNPLKAQPLAQLMVEPSRSPGLRALGHTWLAHFELIRGRLERAQQQLAAAGLLDPVWRLEYGGILPAVPFLPISPELTRAFRQELLNWSAETVPASKNPGSWFAMHDDFHPQIRLYLAGLLSAQLKEYAAAQRHLQGLAKWSGDPDFGSLIQDMQLTVRAQIALRHEQFENALGHLEAMQLQAWYNFCFASPFFSQSYPRYLRAELLQRMGRYEEALVWYGSFEENSVYDLIYLPPSYLHRGEIYEKLGDIQSAIRHYTAFVEFWQDADPELMPVVENVKARLQVLQGAENH